MEKEFSWLPLHSCVQNKITTTVQSSNIATQQKMQVVVTKFWPESTLWLLCGLHMSDDISGYWMVSAKALCHYYHVWIDTRFSSPRLFFIARARGESGNEASRVSFSFSPKEQNEIVWIIGGGKYVSVCKTCGKLGGSGGKLPWEILILDLLLDAVWWNRRLFSHKHNLPFIVLL